MSAPSDAWAPTTRTAAPGRLSLEPRTSSTRLLRAYLIGVYAVGLFFVLRTPTVPAQTAIAAFLIFVAALAPAYFWCSGRATSLPLFPLFALTYSWTYALPLLTGHPVATLYSPDDHLIAGLAVSGFLALATLVWLPLTAPRLKRRRVMFVVFPGRGIPWMISSVGLNVVVQLANQAGALSLPFGTTFIVRAALLGLSSVAAFVLPYLWGRGRLRGGAAVTAAGLLVLDGLASLGGLLLVNLLAKFALVMLGLTLGERKLRVVPLVAVLALLTPLHYGKHRMRDEYWRSADGEVIRVSPAQYPAFLAQWVRYSIDNLTGDPERRHAQSFSERASLIQLFLLAREKQLAGTPGLRGATYAVIPTLLVPRVLAPDKPSSHEGTTLLNIHHGLQRREDAQRSTIGWGLFNEAFANFGYPGLAGLAVVIGFAFGGFARWTEDVPELSARFLMGVLVLGITFQTEFSAGVLVTSLFQSAVAVAGLVLLLGGGRVVVAPRERGRLAPTQADDETESGPSAVPEAVR